MINTFIHIVKNPGPAICILENATSERHLPEHRPGSVLQWKYYAIPEADQLYLSEKSFSGRCLTAE